MKFYIFLPLALIVGCTKTADVQKPPVDAELIAVYSHVGQWHNECMEAVYSGIIEHRIHTIADYENIVHRTLSSYGIKNGHEVVFTNQIDFNVLTPLMKEAATEMNAVVHSGDIELLELIRDRYLAGELTLTEKKAIIGMASVIKYSYLYWNKNAFKWQALIPKPLAMYRDSKDIVFADAVGAGIGAVRGAIVGGISGTTIPGLGTVTGAAAGGLYGMVSGAVSASVAEGVWHLIKGWINWKYANGNMACQQNTQYVSACTTQDSIHWALDYIKAHNLYLEKPDSLTLTP